MIKHLAALVALLLSSLLISGCSDKKKEDPEPPAPTGSRTVLVYMVANNSLGGETAESGFDYNDRREMIAAAKNGDLGTSRWLVYYCSRYAASELQELTADGFKTIKTYDSATPSVSQDRMKTVIADMKKIAPAERYGLVLWSHSSGWLQDGIVESRGEENALSFGDDKGKRMNITSLRDAIAGQGFDYIYADVCFFNTVEVAYELKSAVKTIAGSTTQLPANGQPYDKNLKLLAAYNANLVAAAANTFEDYNSASSGTKWCTMSVINTAGMNELAQATKRIYQSSTYPVNYFPQVLEDISTCYYYDLSHFVQALSPAAFTEWEIALNNAVLYTAATERLRGGTTIKSHCGLSTYILSSETSSTVKNYDTLAWFNDVAQFQPLP